MERLGINIRVVLKPGIDPYVLRSIELYATFLRQAGHAVYCNDGLDIEGVKSVIATEYHLFLVGSAIHTPRGTNCKVVNLSRIGFERELAMYLL